MTLEVTLLGTASAIPSNDRAGPSTVVRADEDAWRALATLHVDGDVVLGDASARRFEVVGRRSDDKDSLPLAELFTRNGEPVLTLVTCGGPFDPETRSYRENLVVFAVPAGAT